MAAGVGASFGSGGGWLMKCDGCGMAVGEGEFHEFRGRTLCDDCYIDATMPKVRKTWNPNGPAEFMERLKDTYSIHPQKYH